jgi:hypothetical protein
MAGSHIAAIPYLNLKTALESTGISDLSRPPPMQKCRLCEFANSIRLVCGTRRYSSCSAVCAFLTRIFADVLTEHRLA